MICIAPNLAQVDAEPQARSCAIAADVSDRKSGAGFTLEEIGVCEVRAGKIVREAFFYPPRAWRPGAARDAQKLRIIDPNRLPTGGECGAAGSRRAPGSRVEVRSPVSS
jgi:hypothetical protein